MYVPYPLLDDPKFNSVLSNKKEFTVKANHQQTKQSFSLTVWQRFVKNYLSPSTPYNGILLFHGTGTGKTCTAISIAEQFSFKKPHLVLLPPNLEHGFKKQIFDVTKLVVEKSGGIDFDNVPQCTGSKYPLLVPNRRSLPLPALEDKVNKIINARWQFKGYMKFANEYHRLKEEVAKSEKQEARRAARFDKVLRDIYSDRVIVIDEAHNLKTASEETAKRVPPTIEHVLRVAQNVKLILLTATPMFDNASEIVYLLNLLLINDKRQPIDVKSVFDSSNTLTKEGAQALVEASRGYVSFQPVDNPEAYPLRLYPKLPPHRAPKYDFFGEPYVASDMPKAALVSSHFGDHQRAAYEALRPSAQTSLDLDAGTETNYRLQAIVQISNIAYPASTKKKSKADDDFSSCFTASGGRWSYNTSVVAKHGEFLSPELIGKYASKMKRIVDYILSSEGVVYVYSSFIYSGVLPLAFALEHAGFQKFGGTQLLKSANKTKGKGSYILLTANKDLSPNNDAEIAAAKHLSNKDGEKVKVILGSNVATEGIDFKFIREVHILEPWYNLSKVEQIIGRAVRQNSHADLPPEKRNVTVYQHVNLLDDTESVDLYICRIAQNKHDLISRVDTILKENAIDCIARSTVQKKKAKEAEVLTSQGQRLRVRPSYHQTSRCLPINAPQAPQNPDTTTFSTAFLLDDILDCKKSVKHVFKYTPIHSMSTLKAALESAYDNEVLFHALQQLLDARDTIVTSDGIPCYLMYRSNKYMLHPFNARNKRAPVQDRIPSSLLEQEIGRRKISLRQIRNAQTPPTPNLEPDTKTDGSFLNVQKAVTQLLQNLSAKEHKKYTQQAYDFVVDRLPANEHLQLLQEWSSLPTEISSSLRSSELVVMDANNHPRYYIDINSKDAERYYVLKGGAFVKCSRLEYPALSRLEAERQSSIAATIKTIDNVLAFVAPERLKHRMKIIREKATKSTGSVCASTSEFTVESMKQLISQYTGDDASIATRASKVVLCEVYELILRKHAAHRFLRPFPYLALTTHLKSERKKKT